MIYFIMNILYAKTNEEFPNKMFHKPLELVFIYLGHRTRLSYVTKDVSYWSYIP